MFFLGPCAKINQFTALGAKRAIGILWLPLDIFIAVGAFHFHGLRYISSGFPDLSGKRTQGYWDALGGCGASAGWVVVAMLLFYRNHPEGQRSVC